MSNFLDGNSQTRSGLRTLLKLIKQRYIQKDEIIPTGPEISTIMSKNDTIKVSNGYYNIVSNITRGLRINIERVDEFLDDRIYIQFRTGEDISVGIKFNVPISRIQNEGFLLESNKLYVIKLTQDPINNGYLMEWYKE